MRDASKTWARTARRSTRLLGTAAAALAAGLWLSVAAVAQVDRGVEVAQRPSGSQAAETSTATTRSAAPSLAERIRGGATASREAGSTSQDGVGVTRSLSDGLGLTGLSNPWKFSARYTLEQSGQKGQVSVSATIEPGYYIFSTTQPKGGPVATFISVDTAGVSTAGAFLPDRDPKVVYNMKGFEGVRVEKFYNTITWTAPIVLEKAPGAEPPPLQLKIDGQVCRDECIPIIGAQVTASFEGYYTPVEASDGPYRGPDEHVTWTVRLADDTIPPGGETQLEITGTPDADYHLYPLAIQSPEVTNKTLIVLQQKGGLLAEEPTASSQPVEIEKIPGELTDRYHSGPVTWTVTLRAPESLSEGVYPLHGLVGYQVCTDETCDPPAGLQFSGEVKIGQLAAADQPVSLAIQGLDASKVAAADAGEPWIDRSLQLERPALSGIDLLQYFSLAVLGGLILNLMPCVLPVIGIKLTSFLSEASHDNRRSQVLNLWYIAGLMSIFVVLAIATIAVRYSTGTAMGWGSQAQNVYFQMGLVIFFFAFALAFLGVWEIPSPSSLLSRASNASPQEGPAAAFSKGVVTTVAAVPCSGPFLGPVFGLAVTQAWYIILLMYLGVGIGLAMPFILFAIDPRIPKMLLPKPGAWMDTLKQFLAFPLLLSVVWFFSSVQADYQIPLLVTLVFVGMGCWIFGRVPAYAEPSTRWQTLGVAALVPIIAGYVSFEKLGPREELIAWQQYDEMQLDEYVAQGRPVMLDFTANWCANCKINLWTAIETEEVAEFIEKHDVVPMLADWSDRNTTILSKLHELNSNAIPVLAIYSPGQPDSPIVLRDLLTQSKVLAALEKAAVQDPMQTASPASKTAKTARVTSASQSEPIFTSNPAEQNRKVEVR